MAEPAEILYIAFERASASVDTSIIDNTALAEGIEFVCRNVQNRAGARFMLAALLAKVHNPDIDIRKPYTEIREDDAYSGRTYDEAFVSAFINQHNLPCNPTTAFLTPALRNRDIVLTPDVNLVGRPPRLYEVILQLLDAVHNRRVSADDLLAETIRWLLVVRDERQQRVASLLAALKTSDKSVPLSSEAIVSLIQ